MRKMFFLLLVLGLVMIGIAVFLFVKTKQTGVAALQATSIPPAVVLLDGKQIGKTPFRDNVPSGEHTVKITPEGAKGVFEQKLSLIPNILTVIDRNFDEAGPSGHTLTLFPLPDKNEVQITVISTPTGASVTLDSELKGITPLIVKNATASDHELIVAKEGYQERIIRVKTAAGYKLVANVDLAVSINPTPQPEAGQPLAETPTPTATPSAKIVRIGQTPNNFLRVRAESSLSSREITRVKPGETFPLLEEQTGWFKIHLPDGTEGWVSSQYSEKIVQ